MKSHEGEEEARLSASLVSKLDGSNEWGVGGGGLPTLYC